MTDKADQDFNKAFASVLETHPAFKGVDGDAMRQLAESLNAGFETIFTPRPDVAMAWTESMLSYQSAMTQAWLSALSGGGDQDEGTRKDRRFKGEAWAQGIFPFLTQAYSLTAKAMTEMADAANLPAHEQRKLSFYTRLVADAMSPSNFAATNPEVLQQAQDTKGASLVAGFNNFLEDMKKGYITTSDESDFVVGGNLANTPGSVVFRNDLFELIQYHPLTPKVNAKPVLIVPPCVNKFYIFDINEKKSMVRYMLEQGLSVFMMSWRNPSPDGPDFAWDDYIDTGIFTALSVCQDISKADKIDMMSWCNGGTMLLVALAIMENELKAHVGTATFLSSMIDFSDPGEVEVFIDRPQLEAYNFRLQTAKVAPGRDIARAMSMLHVNESIWNFVVSNYLLGKSPPPFDILFWNSDTSNLPAKWYSYYVEKMYLGNLLKEPGALTILGKPVDTHSIDVPCFFVAATGDHIVPWKTSYAATSLVAGEAEFLLTDGGHVSGTVINHPDKSRRSYFHAGDRSLDAEGWQASAEMVGGSWWPEWISWLERHEDKAPRAAKKTMGNRKYPVLAPAPGAYVTESVKQDGM